MVLLAQMLVLLTQTYPMAQYASLLVMMASDKQDRTPRDVERMVPGVIQEMWFVLVSNWSLEKLFEGQNTRKQNKVLIIAGG